MNKSKIKNYLLYLAVVIFIVVIYLRRNKWNERLSSEDGKFTVAHVYSTKKTKEQSPYHYIYKVNLNYYSTATSGSNVKSFKEEPVQCFLVAYDQNDPSIHTVIWSYKYKSIIPLGQQIEDIENKAKLVSKHTVGWSGLSPRANKNDLQEVSKYNSIKQ